MRIGRRFRFEAAHRLPLHDGACRRPHGHSYTLEVVIEGPVNVRRSGSQGMVMDFKELKEIVNRTVIDKVDHQDLNTLEEGAEEANVTTAELLCETFAEEITMALPKGIQLVSIRLSETADSWAEWLVPQEKRDA